MGTKDNRSPSIDSEKFPDTPALLFWTSEPSGTPARPEPYSLDFSNNGKVMMIGPDGPQHYRCVRATVPGPPTPTPPAPLTPPPAPTPPTPPPPAPTPSGECHAISPVVQMIGATQIATPQCQIVHRQCAAAIPRQHLSELDYHSYASAFSVLAWPEARGATVAPQPLHCAGYVIEK